MARNTLLDFFEDFSTRDDTFIVHDDGYRVREMSYRQVADAARAWAAMLSQSGITSGDKVVLWSENRAEWIAALWGCLLEGAVVVPVDFRASGDLVARISAIVGAKIVLVGHEVTAPPEITGRVMPLTDAIVFPDARAVATTRGAAQPATAAASAPLTGATLAEIIFTSGATADPKGVTITHRNVLANIIPIEREIAKYRRYARPFHPLRFLNLLPLSHMFGQSMATFVPPMLAGTVVFSHGYSPSEILRQIKSRRVSVLVCVPKVLDVLREHIERVSPVTAAPDPLAGRHWAWRWWHYREVHRLFGFKFWCIVCGAAPLEPDLEAFWRKLGFLVVQGYGLTETAPIVTLNHPLRASKGTVGTPIGGVEVKIAPDGEILVRGDNVTSGYYVPDSAPGSPKSDEGGPKPGPDGPKSDDNSAFRDGWFHTGDIGELDAAGRLLIKGRKKEMIVTPQGLNVFPEDVERAIAAQAGVKDAGVVGLRVEGEERIHAVLVLDAGANLDAIVRGANAQLEDHQRIWSTSIWPAGALPRTEGTQKLKRREVQRWAAGEQTSAPTRATSGVSVEAIVARYSAGRDVTNDTSLEELGLSSLDRVELMMALEEAFHTTLDEAELSNSRTIGEIKELLGAGSPMPAAPTAPPRPGTEAVQAQAAPTSRPPAPAREPIAFPSWNRSGLSWFIRRISLPTWILPLGRPFMDMTVRGVEHLDAVDGPVVFAANHQSHMDGPAILIALPPKWRYRIAPAMAKEFFRAHFNRREFGWKAWFTNSLNYYLACQFFNAFPLPQREAGTRETMRYMGEVLADGYSILIFPEGRRERDEVGTFRPGIGMIGSKLEVPVVPVRVEGLDKVLDPKMKWPKRGPVRVSFGKPLRLTGDDYPALAKQVEQAVRDLGQGGQPGADPGA